MKINQVMRVANISTICFTGAGGKTTILFHLAHALDRPVLVTTSTHLGDWQLSMADVHLVIRSASDLPAIEAAKGGVILATGAVGEDHRARGLETDLLRALREIAQQLGSPLLIEGDGSRQKPLKAPAEHEPVIPDWTDTVIVTAGLSGLGQPLDDAHVHRAAIFAELSGLSLGSQVDAKSVAHVLKHPLGGLKKIPAGAYRIAVLNQADRPDLVMQGREIARELEGQYDAVAITSMRSSDELIEIHERSAGVVLAAGGASRFGSPKALLDWHGKTLVRRAAETAVRAGLDPVIVVTGAAYNAIRDALAGVNVTLLHNPAWEEGQSTSLKLGLRAAMKATVGSAVFLLADQPFATPEVVRALRLRHAQTLAAIIAPQVNGSRANPALFDRTTFAALLNISGDTGGRSLFGEYPHELVEFDDERLLFDIDTPEDYQRLLEMR